MRIFISLSFLVSFYILVLFFSFVRHRAKLGLKSWFFIHFHKMKEEGRRSGKAASSNFVLNYLSSSCDDANA
jgi:hypothetical protein